MYRTVQTFIRLLISAMGLQLSLTLLVGCICERLQAQELQFNRVLNRGTTGDYMLAVAQDKYGFIWLTQQLGGLQRYDGRELKPFPHDPNNPNSPASNYIESFIIDTGNIFWLGTIDAGLDRYDPAANTFAHYRHNEKDPSTIISDKINMLMADKAGNIWIGTDDGLDMLDKKTGKFTHYVHDPQDNGSLSNNVVKMIYEDRAGVIWVGCGDPLNFRLLKTIDGGLNRLNKTTGKFTRYVHDDKDPSSLAHNKVKAIFEDSKGNFWVGSAGDGLHVMDREKGTFKHYYYDAKHPGKLSRPPQAFSNEGVPEDHISFITEDADGMILIGAFFQGINYFNPGDSTVKHYGPIYKSNLEVIKGDTASGLKTGELFRIFHSRDGLLWIPTLGGDLYTAQPANNNFPYYALNAKEPDVNTLYCEPDGNILWIGTDQGLFRKDLHTGAMKVWLHDPGNAQSICSDTILSIKPGDEGKLWMATDNGLTLFDPVLNTFRVWKHDKRNPKSMHSNRTSFVFIDKQKTIWIGFSDAGIDKMDLETETFTNFRHEKNNTQSLSHNYVNEICEDRNGYIWIATDYGLDKLDKKDRTIYHYIPNETVRTVIMDKKGIIWASPFFSSVMWYDSVTNNFQAFKDASLKKEINKVINIIEDKQGNLWCTKLRAIVRIDEKRENVKIYDEKSGIHETKFQIANNYVNDKGELFLGDQSGYYNFSPALLKDINLRPSVVLTSFRVRDKEVTPGKKQPLAIPIPDAQEIKLNYSQNSFSFEFAGINYKVEGKMNYLFKLDNYDQEWHNIGTEHSAYFYNIPPGNYTLWIKAISEDGAVGKQKIIITITPPWWRTWWAYTLFALLFIAAVWSFIYYHSRQLVNQNRRLENKVAIRTRELKNEKEKVESTLIELKSTQAQLIQSEKMASLGQLTAGIAHEIQNPLNFVNNFSEINEELIDEAGKETDKGNITGIKEILNDLKENSAKINHHGKRAEAIVKGMLQHSRTSTGQKTLTTINTLADEYLLLAFHGMRAKEKSFNAAMKTDFDETIGKIDIIPQDIGRVLLNLCNNALYAVYEKKKKLPEGYEPAVSVSTKKAGDKILIQVTDNGNGIPQTITDKIFQPFFTTKPTGEGTGLGLSISYDIIKAHGGNIEVKSKENEGTTFIIEIPANV